jgi:hypothetical protein
MDAVLDKEYYVIRSNQGKVLTGLDIDWNKGWTHIAVCSASIPKTYYVIPTDCSLEINEGGVIKTIPIVKGNYNIQSFINIFTSLFPLYTSWTYSLSFPLGNSVVQTGKYTFSVSGNSSQPSIRATNVYLASLLGFEEDTWYTFTGNTLSSVKVVDLQSYDELIIKCDAVKNREKILQEIYTGANAYNSSIVFNNLSSDLNAKILNKVNGNVFTFILLDSNGNQIDLNGGYWSMIICLLKIDNINTAIKKYIGLRSEEIINSNSNGNTV